jgi:hypothetical protein
MDKDTEYNEFRHGKRIPDNDPDVEIDRDGHAWIHVNGRAYRYPYFDTTAGERPNESVGDTNAAPATFRLIGNGHSEDDTDG